jgi:hypothetical protein
MNKKTTGKIMFGIGILFILNAIFGRYLVLPGYLSYLERGKISTVPREMDARLVIGMVKTVVWMFSFKLGALFALIGASLYAHVQSRRIWLFTLGFFLYLVFMVIPIPGPYSIAFGIGGGFIALLFFMIIHYWARYRTERGGEDTTVSDLRMVGYVFFAFATYNLCGFCGVGSFAIYPEKMIRFGLQSQAASQASHILIELVLGWFFIFLSQHKAMRIGREGLKSSSANRELM